MKKVAVTILIGIILIIPTLAFAMSGDRVSLGYIYHASQSHTEIVNSSNGNINTVSPTCLDLSNDGHLVINNIFNQEFVNEMHEKGVLVTPFLSNHWSKLKGQAALSNADILTDEIVEAIHQYHLDGVNIDIENLNAKDKDDLTNFVKLLREKMTDEKILSIAVAANPNKLSSSWVAAYDVENLAKYVDYLVLMAYDEHSNGGVAGPVASISFVEESIKVMLETVSRDKIVLGMPLYGRFWKEVRYINEETEEEIVDLVGGEAIIMSQIERIADRYKTAMPIYNELTGTVSITIEVESGDNKAYVNGSYLDGGKYTIWYENETSFSKKLEVMNQYGLRGAALWAIGNEGKNFWNYYENGFQNVNYESERSIKERQYYEEVTRIMKYVKPLELTVPLMIDDKLQEAFKEKDFTQEEIEEFFTTRVEEKVHLPEEKKEDDVIIEINEPVIYKEKKYKQLDHISIVHMIKRENKI